MTYTFTQNVGTRAQVMRGTAKIKCCRLIKKVIKLR